VFLLDNEISKYVNGYDEEWCGYHSRWKYQSMGTFAVIGSGGNVCKWNLVSDLLYTSTPHNDVGIDYIYSMIAHEVSEAMSNPFFTKWYDSKGFENGDKCNSYSVVQIVGNKTSKGKGQLYNTIIGGQHYLLQANYDNEKNECPQVIWDDDAI